MRFYEIIKEASIFTRGTYTYGHKVRISSSKKGSQLLNVIQSYIPGFQSSEDLEWVPSATKGATVTKIQVGSGDDKIVFKRATGDFLRLVGTIRSIESLLTHAPGQKGSTAENKGDMSEPVLSAAVVAKLIARGSAKIADIGPDDVKKVMSQAISASGQKFTVQDKNSNVSDTITFTIALRGPALQFLSSPQFWDSYGELLMSAVHYANSGQIDRYADYFYANGKADEIRIVSDGQSDQKSRKTDIEAFANGKPLRNLNISLKAGSPHIGQVGGGTIKNPAGKKGVYTNAVRLFGPLGVNISAPTDAITSKVDYWVSVYQQVAEYLGRELQGANARAEAGVIQKIADWASDHGTKGDPKVRLVSLNKGGMSSVHSFRNLFDKLRANHIDLTAVYRQGKSKATGEPRPEIRIFDKNGAGDLVYIRYSSTEDGTKVWNTIEMRELLKKLTTVSFDRTKAVQAQPTAPAVPQAPAAPANTPVLPTGKTTNNLQGNAVQSP